MRYSFKVNEQTDGIERKTEDAFSNVPTEAKILKGNKGGTRRTSRHSLNR